ncbi:MAG: hypothetical protein LBV71_13635 [Prevotella sp.]|jgi:hypothetical protein|nr:hypothetical protein [Prevotella sp.]
MKSTFRILFYVKRDKQKSDGTFPIMCRVTIDGQPTRFNTKVSVNSNIWDAKACGKSSERCPSCQSKLTPCTKICLTLFAKIKMSPVGI